MTLTIEPILPRFGAEISGVDISAPLDATVQAELLRAASTWGVCVFRQTNLDDDAHIAFSRIFGKLELAPVRPGKSPRFGRRELIDVGNLDEEGNIKRDPRDLMFNRGNQLWHTDASFIPTRSSYSLLLAHEVPTSGGQTWFADTRSAYEDLPSDMKKRCEGLQAVHSIWWSRRLAGYSISDDEIDNGGSAVQPLVMPHSSGRDALYLASHIREIIGMSREDGQALVRELKEWATQPQYVFSVDWKAGDLVLWDNLASMHRGGEYDDRNSRRDMRRTTIRDGSVISDTTDAFANVFAVVDKTNA
jgi:alpha-ketoglutarate-dependent 2,4-dichlorophenoxyacetate dioxygenase